MEKNSLTPKEVFDLKKVHSSEKYRRHADRIKVVLLLNQGFSYEEVAQILLINDSTVRRYEKCYQEKGLDGLLEGHYHGRHSLLSSEQCNQIEAYIDEQHLVSTKQLQVFIQERFGIKYSWEATRKLLHKLGFCYRKSEVRPGKLDTTKQELHKQKYEDIKSNNVL